MSVHLPALIAMTMTEAGGFFVVAVAGCSVIVSAAIFGYCLLLEVRDRQTRRARQRSLRDVRSERLAREQCAPFRPHVEVAPVEPPLAPVASLEMRRRYRTNRGSAA